MAAQVPLKFDNVDFWRGGFKVTGTLHITADHIILRYELFKNGVPLTSKDPKTQDTPPPKPLHKESWITYPMINRCVYKPSPGDSPHAPRIRLQCRDFTYVSFFFLTNEEANNAFNMIKHLTCGRKRLEKLYAFLYKPPQPEREENGWALYDPRREFARLGVSKDKGWRITEINKDYVYSPTYPAIMAVPASISDNVLNHSGKYRSKLRIPALTYLHSTNNCSITRCAQPMAGIRGNRNPQDEKLVAAIWATSKISTSSFQSAPVTPMQSRSVSNLKEDRDDTKSLNIPYTESETEFAEDEAIRAAMPDEEKAASRRVYGAQQRNVIVDARPLLNAIANSGKGAGTENMKYYPGAEKAYLGIDNIHVMTNSLNGVIDALKDTDVTPLGSLEGKLQSSGWLKHIANLLDGVGLITRTVGIYHSHVMIHCSDGWDRTSQLSALAQLCLDPYYRTIEGFMVLVEKDWLSFGHMFRHRCGHLNSETWFKDETPSAQTSSTAAAEVLEKANSLANRFFGKKKDLDSFESDPDGMDAPSKHDKKDPFMTDTTEVSPIFFQFLDATWQLMYQNPTQFEFNERFLKRLLYHLYSCQYGTFLWDNEREREEFKAKTKTRSVWDYFMSRKQDWISPQYNGGNTDERYPEKAALIFPNKAKIRWWAGVFGRTDEEMNGVGSPLTEEEITQSAVVEVVGEDKLVKLNKTASSSPSVVEVQSHASWSTESHKASPEISKRLQTPEEEEVDKVEDEDDDDEEENTPAISTNSESSSANSKESAVVLERPLPEAPALKEPSPEVDTDPLGAGVVFGSGVANDSTRSGQMNGLTRGIGRMGIGGRSSPRGSKKKQAPEDSEGTELM